MQRWLVPGTVFVLTSVVTCSGLPGLNQDAGQVADAGQDPGPAPIYAADSTDEAWRSMADAKARTQVSATSGSTFTSPTEGQTVAASVPFTFTWTTPLIAMAPVRHKRGGIGFFSTAHAHGTPVTGDIYWLFFKLPGVAEPMTVLTTEGSWTPTDDEWTRLKAAGDGQIEAEIISAYMTENQVTQGPFKAEGVRRFRIN